MAVATGEAGAAPSLDGVEMRGASPDPTPSEVSPDDCGYSNDNNISCESDSSIEPDDFEDGIQGTSAAQTVFNVVKNIVGEGMLSLPAGIAAGTGLIVGCLITAAFGVLMGYTFAVMGRVCHVTGAKTHKECAAAVSGPRLAQCMAIVLMCKTAFTCVTYAMVIGESCSRILQFFGLSGWYTHRQAVLVAIVLVVLTPLCLQRDLSVLSYTSLFGIVCEVFVLAFMQCRLLDGSYLPEGQYYEAIPAKDRVDFGTPNVPHLWNVSVTTFVLLSSLSTAFIAHYNAPKFYSQMRRRSPRRYGRVVAVAFALAFAIYVWVMSVGYLTFGEHAQGLILNNYADSDPGATAARIAIGFAVLFGFPLSFTALRDATMSTFGLQPEKKRNFVPATMLLLTIITVLGASLTDLGLVNALGGAMFGACITLVFPGLLLYFMAKRIKQLKYSGTPVLPQEKAWSLVVVGLGAVLVVFGSTIVILKKFFPEALAAA